MLTKLPDIIDDKVMAAGEVGTTEQSSVWGCGLLSEAQLERRGRQGADHFADG